LQKKRGSSPGKLLREIHLQQAVHLLLHSTNQVQTIAEKTDHASVPVCITAFKKARGSTPLISRWSRR